MTNFKCPMCKTLWVGAKPTQKHKLWDENKHQTLVAGKSSCTCGVGEDGFILQ